MSSEEPEALVIYRSVHKGNTEKIAEAISRSLECEAKDVSELDSGEIKDYDLVGFGSGVYLRSYHSSLLKFIEELPEEMDRDAFLFSTSGFRRIPILNNFGKRIGKKLRGKGFEVIGEFSCRGEEDYSIFKYLNFHRGRPNQKDLKRAGEFAEEMLEKFKTSH